MKLKLLNLIVFMAPFLVQSQEQPAVSNDSLAKQVDAVKKDLGFLKRIKLSGYLQPQFAGRSQYKCLSRMAGSIDELKEW